MDFPCDSIGHRYPAVFIGEHIPGVGFDLQMGGGHSFHLELEEAGQEGLCALEWTELFEKKRDMEMDAPFSVVGASLASFVGGLKGGGEIYIASQFAPGAFNHLMEVGRFCKRLQRRERISIQTRDAESCAQLDFQDADAGVVEGGQHVVRVLEFDRSMAGIQADAEMSSQRILRVGGCETRQPGEILDRRGTEQVGLKEGHGFCRRFEQAAGFRLQRAGNDAPRRFP